MYMLGDYYNSPWYFWPHQLQPYIKNWQVYACPSNTPRRNYTYHGVTYPVLPNYCFTNPCWRGYHNAPLALAKISRPAERRTLPSATSAAP